MQHKRQIMSKNILYFITRQNLSRKSGLIAQQKKKVRNKNESGLKLKPKEQTMGWTRKTDTYLSHIILYSFITIIIQLDKDGQGAILASLNWQFGRDLSYI